mmetsp:Transcript_25468/g.36505  ORF Transcript_25468/g.36505 Transcript_25468/m.36505 type:complete len:219 (-) Transcript_25468:156-812(-)
MLLLTAFCIPVKGTNPSGNSTTAAPGAEGFLAAAGFFSPVAALTSSNVTRPKFPVPTMAEMSIPAFFAAALAVGVAAITPGAGTHLGLDTASGFLLTAAFPLPPDAMAFSTSAPVIRPSGPVPITVDRSNPTSSARFLANGDATTRPPPEDEAEDDLADVLMAGLGVAAAAAMLAGGAAADVAPPPVTVAAYAFNAGISSLDVAIKATGFPTSQLPPS